MTSIIVALVLGLIVCAVATCIWLSVTTFRYSGDKAASRMNPAELQLLQRVEQIDDGMEAAEVHAMLGEPTREVLGIAKWQGFGGSKRSQLRVYFVDGHPVRIRWIKAGHFIHDKHLGADGLMQKLLSALRDPARHLPPDPENMPGVWYEGGEGATVDEAIVVRGATSDLEGTAAVFGWILTHVGTRDDWSLTSQMSGEVGERHIDTIDIVLSDGTPRRLYFDVTESFGRW
jgi:hypothetical protein